MKEESKYESKGGEFSCCCIKSSSFHGHFVSSTIFPKSLVEVSILRILFRCRHKHSAMLHHPLKTGKVVNMSRGAPQAARENGKPESQVCAKLDIHLKADPARTHIQKSHLIQAVFCRLTVNAPRAPSWQGRSIFNCHGR